MVSRHTISTAASFADIAAYTAAACRCETSSTSLAAAGKKPKVILAAVMRKMITTLNAMLRDGAGWQPQAA